MSTRGPYRWCWRPEWLALLRSLHDYGHGDPRIAAELSLAFDPELFTAGQVRHQRRSLGLPPRRCRQRPPLTEARCWSWRRYQVRQGWGHLLPAYVRAVGARREGGRPGHWTAGHELRPAETRLLSLLRDQGPLSRRSLLASLGLADVQYHQGKYLGRLLSRGLISRNRGRTPTYVLAGAAALSPRISLV